MKVSIWVKDLNSIFLRKVDIIVLFRDEINVPNSINEYWNINSHKNELTFIDGNSEENTQFDFQKIGFAPIKIIKNHSKFTSHGINLGINRSTAENFGISGYRSLVDEDYWDIAAEILNKNEQIGCVGGRIIHSAHTETGKAIATAMGATLGMGVFSFRSLQKSGYTDTVSVPVFRKDVIEKVGLFDETLIRNQDDDYSYRIIKAGFKIWHETSISSTYYVREKYGQLSGQFFQYGFWKNYVNKKHKTITTIRQLAPPIFVITQIILLFISPTILVLLLSVYLILIGIQSIALSHFKLITSIKTLYAFIVMHYSYGLGYLSGFMYAFILNKQPPEFVKKITR